jgi:hypothetical protein
MKSKIADQAAIYSSTAVLKVSTIQSQILEARAAIFPGSPFIKSRIVSQFLTIARMAKPNGPVRTARISGQLSFSQPITFPTTSFILSQIFGSASVVASQTFVNISFSFVGSSLKNATILSQF